MKRLFNKYNAFNVIFFLTVLIMAIFKNKETISAVSPILSFLIFMLSILSYIISWLESIINKYNEIVERVTMESCYNIYNLYYPENIFFCAVVCKYQIALEELKDFFYVDLYSKKEMLNALISNYSIRIFRRIRKVLLFFYYVIILLIFSTLTLNEDLMPILDNLHFCDFTIWSLVIILFQILLGDAITASFFSMIESFQDKKTSRIINRDSKIKIKKMTKMQESKLEELRTEQNQVFKDLWKLMDNNFDKTEQALILKMTKEENEGVNIVQGGFYNKVVEMDNYFTIINQTESCINVMLEYKFKELLLYSEKKFNKISSIPIENIKTTDFSNLID